MLLEAQRAEGPMPGREMGKDRKPDINSPNSVLNLDAMIEDAPTGSKVTGLKFDSGCNVVGNSHT
jgi:hypothetical protein